MTLKHKHHIIPKHMGGTNDKSNLIELTVKKHALAHKKLYEKYGKWEDLFAYKALSGRIKNEHIHRERSRLANLGNKHFLGKTHNNETRKKISEGNMVAKLGNKYRLGKTFTQESKDKMSESAKLRTDDKNSFFGKQHSDETRMKISKSKKGKPSYIRTEEHRQKMSEIIKRRKACTNTSAKLEEL